MSPGKTFLSVSFASLILAPVSSAGHVTSPQTLFFSNGAGGKIQIDLGTVQPESTVATHVLNLVEGREAVVESPNGAFEPFVVHYAETFIVPASVGRYTIRPHGESVGHRCATLKAFIR